jgi:hypothetical protein
MASSLFFCSTMTVRAAANLLLHELRLGGGGTEHLSASWTVQHRPRDASGSAMARATLRNRSSGLGRAFAHAI